ncbi:hypothetical protein ACJX0J_035062, partial [Zea mays]
VIYASKGSSELTGRTCPNVATALGTLDLPGFVVEPVEEFMQASLGFLGDFFCFLYLSIWLIIDLGSLRAHMSQFDTEMKNTCFFMLPKPNFQIFRTIDYWMILTLEFSNKMGLFIETIQPMGRWHGRIWLDDQLILNYALELWSVHHNAISHLFPVGPSNIVREDLPIFFMLPFAQAQKLPFWLTKTTT